MGYIDSINSSDFNSNSDYLIAGENRIINCSTDANVQAKTATVPKGYTLDSNIAFLIKFTNGNTVTSPTLNLTPEDGTALGAINLVGNAKKLDNNNNIIDANDNTLLANVIYMCYYDGTKFVIDNNCTYHVGNSSNPHNVTKAQVGLDNVDNCTSQVLICNSPASSLIKEVNLSSVHIEEHTVIRVLLTQGTEDDYMFSLRDSVGENTFPIVDVSTEIPLINSEYSGTAMNELPPNSTVDLMWVNISPPSQPDPTKIYVYWRVINVHKPYKIVS